MSSPSVVNLPPRARGAMAMRAASMPRSAIREIMALAAGRKDVIHLEVGEPDFGTPPAIVEAAFEKVRAGATRYTPNAGVMPLRELIARRASARAGVAIAPEQVIVTTGAIGALFTAVFLLADPGDEVLIPDPGWPNYDSICHLAGAKGVRYVMRAENGFVPDPDELARLVTPATKAIMLNSPGNPTGAVFPRAQMQAIGRLARERGICLISDEIYEDILFSGEHVSAASITPSEQVMIVSGLSKTYAMTGWRLGYLVVPAEMASHAAGLQEPITSCPSAPSQMAAIAALEGPQDMIGEFRDIFRRRCDILTEIFSGTNLLPAVPQGAFYALVDISGTGQGSLAFAKEFLAKQSVAVVPGITFGPSCDRYVRVAFTIADEALRDGLVRLRDHLQAASR